MDGIESIQGRLGSRQDLRYAKNNNKAWYSPAGATNTARNYAPRFIGMRRTLDGRNYYAVRKKSSFTNSTDSRKACALMGATASIWNYASHDLSVWTNIQNAYRSYLDHGGQDTMRRWASLQIRPQIEGHASDIYLTAPSGSVLLGGNPFVAGSTNPMLIPYPTFSKFYLVIGTGYRQFQVRGFIEPCVYAQGMTFKNWIDSELLNYWGFTFWTGTGNPRAKLGSLYLVDEEGVYVNASVAISGSSFELRA